MSKKIGMVSAMLAVTATRSSLESRLTEVEEESGLRLEVTATKMTMEMHSAMVT